MKTWTRWTRARIIAGVRAERRRGTLLNPASVDRRNSNLYQAAIRHLGSWDAALRAAGVDPARVRRAIRWSRERVIVELRCLKGPMSGAQALQFAPRLVYAACRFFCTWARACEAAGVPCLRWPRWSPRRVLEEIRARVARSCSLRTTVMRREAQGLYAAATREFGSWRSAVAKAGFPGHFPPRLTRDRLLEEIRRLARATPSAGQRPFSRKRLTRAAWLAFGSWGAACRAAGVSVRKLRRARK